ncbi:MAG TPA: Wzz/FepE/Etk N-terminal domain-containing protein [Gemmatimonadales bacterium]
MTAGLKPGLEPARGTPAEADISLFELMTPLVTRWKLVAATAIACALIAAVVLLLQRPTYTATTTFTPENSSTSGLMSGLAGLAGLAGQLGLSSSSPSSVSPDFFVKLAHSDEVLRSTLLMEFVDPDSATVRRPLLRLLEVKGRSSEEQIQRGVRVLRKRTEASADKSTGIVTLKVKLQSPVLAAEVAKYMVQLLNRFNLESRQSQSREQRRFSGERLAVAEQELRAAEQAQLAFLQRNRQYLDSPLLAFEYNRLNRQVQLRQEVYQTVTKAYEEARIAEVRDTPVLTVIDSAVAPVKPSGPRRVLGSTVALVFGGALGVLLAYVAAALSRTRRSPTADYLEFRAALEEARRSPPRG